MLKNDDFYLVNGAGGGFKMWKSFSLETSRSRWCTAHLKLRLRFPLICKKDTNQIKLAPI